MRLLYQFAAGSSFLHRLDPRTKTVFIAANLVVALVLPELYLMFALLAGIVLVLWLLAGIGPKEYWPLVAFLAPVAIALTVIDGFSIPEPPYYAIPGFPLRLSIPGSVLGFTIGLRLAAMGLSYAMFAMTTEPFQLSLALHKFGIKFKYGFFISFALRFLPLLQEELLTISNAAKVRAYPPMDSANPITRLKGLVSIIPTLGLISVKRSGDIALGMELRGFSLQEKRTFLKEIKFRNVDYLVIVVSCLYLIAGLYVWLILFKGTQYVATTGYNYLLAVLWTLIPAIGLATIPLAIHNYLEKKKKKQLKNVIP